MTVEERNAIVRDCRAGDDAAADLGLVSPGWENLEALGADAVAQATQIALDYARLVGILPDPDDDGTPVQVDVLRDWAGKG